MTFQLGKGSSNSALSRKLLLCSAFLALLGCSGETEPASPVEPAQGMVDTFKHLRVETEVRGCSPGVLHAFVKNTNKFPVNVVICKESIDPGKSKRREFLDLSLDADEKFPLGCTKTGSVIHGHAVHWQTRTNQSFPDDITDAKQALTVEIIAQHEYLRNPHFTKQMHVNYRKGTRREMAVLDTADYHLVLPYPGDLEILSARYTPVGYSKNADCR